MNGDPYAMLLPGRTTLRAAGTVDPRGDARLFHSRTGALVVTRCGAAAQVPAGRRLRSPRARRRRTGRGLLGIRDRGTAAPPRPANWPRAAAESLRPRGHPLRPGAEDVAAQSRCAKAAARLGRTGDDAPRRRLSGRQPRPRRPADPQTLAGDRARISRPRLVAPTGADGVLAATGCR